MIWDNKHEHTAKLDSMALKHDEEMKNLKKFCEKKDMVMSKQLENISWAGKLLEQRDAELEEMQRKLNAAEDGQRCAEQFAKGLAHSLG